MNFLGDEEDADLMKNLLLGDDRNVLHFLLFDALLYIAVIVVVALIVSYRKNAQ
jgi:hypothetical protein